MIRHWSQLIDGLLYSPQRFYDSLREAIESRAVPRLGWTTVPIREGAPLISGKRLYLRVERLEQRMEICAAPFGRGFFVSWWLVLVPSASLA